jgi:adenylyltransferase/sulfurtransferase
LKTAASIEITSAELAEKIVNKSPFVLIDVRELYERELFNIGGEHIPLQTFLSQEILSFSPSDTIIIYCEKGSRSLTAAQFLINKGFTTVFSLKGGIENYPMI